MFKTLEVLSSKAGGAAAPFAAAVTQYNIAGMTLVTTAEGF